MRQMHFIDRIFTFNFNVDVEQVSFIKTLKLL